MIARVRVGCRDVKCEDDQGGGEVSDSRDDGSEGEEGDNPIAEAVDRSDREVGL